MMMMMMMHTSSVLHRPSPMKRQLDERNPIMEMINEAAARGKALTQAGGAPNMAATTPLQQNEQRIKLRQAMYRLVNRPAFLDMLADELKGVGLLS